MTRAMYMGLFVTLLLMPLGAEKPDAESLMQTAIKKEIVDGDLNGAIKQYAAIVSNYKTDRPVAAMALVRMAGCYQKLGDAQAREIYELVVKDYGDQKEAVAIARAGLRDGRQNSRLLWSCPGFLGGISPDGRYVTCVDQASNLILHEMATGVDRRLVSNTGSRAHVMSPVISGDGKQVAYCYWARAETRHYHELRLANLTGDPAPRRLYESTDETDIYPFDWSPDGKWIAVELDGDDRDQIGLVSVADGSLRVLKTLSGSDTNQIFFSPNGKYLGYDSAVNDSGDRRGIFILSIDGATAVQGPSHRGQDRMMGWSPDGTRVLFTSDSNGSIGLWAMLFADGKLQGQPELLKENIGSAQSFGVTRAGALYYSPYHFDLDGLNVHLASLDFETGKLLSSPRDVAPESRESLAAPVWSPDGRYLAYVSVRPGHNAVVIRSAETGQVVRELPTRMTNLIRLAWAPDGRSLIAPGWFAGGSGIHRIDAQTGDVSTLVRSGPGGALWFPGLSPDGQKLYFTRGNGVREDIVERDLASGAEKQLLQQAVEGFVILSPDGRHLVGASIDPASNSRTLLLIPTFGAEPREIMRVPSEVQPVDLGFTSGFGLKGQALIPAAWTPDSRAVIARKRLADEKERDEVWLVPVDGSAPHKLNLRLERDRLLGVNAISVHPDGHQIAYMTTAASTQQASLRNLWVLENFLPPSK